MAPEPKPSRRDNSVDYLRERREVRTEWNTNFDDTVKTTNWKEKLKKGDSSTKYDEIMMASAKLQQKAEMAKQIHNVEAHNEPNTEYDELMIDAIHAKLAVLNDI